MAASMWKMNGVCRKMTGLLLLCTLLLSSEVTCQETDAPSAPETGSDDAAGTTVAPVSGQATSAAPGGDSSASASPEHASTQPPSFKVENPGTIPASAGDAADDAINNLPKWPRPQHKPTSQSQAIDSKNSDNQSSSGSSVFVGILVSGLLAALGITVGYFKCQRRPATKGQKLAEEAYPADQQNQGNTLVSDAPLNPPPETPEKPNVNGESPEAAKTPTPPPTNGTPTTKTADTEL
ncbi:uncharacterized protein cd34 [Pholidichthys leucotaenia]